MARLGSCGRRTQRWTLVAGLPLALAAALSPAQTAATLQNVAPGGDLRQGRELLMHKDFGAAEKVFAGYLQLHPGAVQAQLGVGDAQLGQHKYEAAELSYRAVVAQQPQLWQAHKNLVVVEAALGRWEEFERERTVLRMARERGAPGISARESDVIDSFKVRGGLWVVRAYFQPLGRSQARYNFERFSPEGRVLAYVSLEDAEAARAALTPGDVRIGTPAASPPANSPASPALSLNWYTGTAHATIHRYASGEPAYERLRGDVIRWLRAHPEIAGAGTETGPEQRSQDRATAPPAQREPSAAKDHR